MNLRQSMSTSARTVRARMAELITPDTPPAEEGTEAPLPEHGQVTFSMHGEDMAVLRTLERRSLLRDPGFYVDVGAFHPLWGSNTALFHARGWRGLNVEPNPSMAHTISAARPDDVTMACAVGSPRRRGELHYFYEWASSNTMVESFAEMISETQDVRVAENIEVDVIPLHELLAEHGPQGGSIDFLSVDVEGMDLEVLASNDWERFRPTVVAVEDLEMRLDEASASPINEFMGDRGYRLSSHVVLTSIYMQTE